MSLELYKEIISLVLPKALMEYFDVVDVKMRELSPTERRGVESGEITFYL